MKPLLNHDLEALERRDNSVTAIIRHMAISGHMSILSRQLELRL